MIIKHFLFAAYGLFAVQAAHAADQVRVTVHHAASDALTVTYELPAACSKLPFLKDGPSAGRIRANWQALDDCGKADGDSLARGSASCKALSFRVPATVNKVAGYPGSFPTGRGIYAHMSNYAVGEACGPVQYRFSAPGSIFSGLAHHQGEAPAHADAAGLLFGERQAGNGKGLDYFDPRINAAAVESIYKYADGTEAMLLKEFPNAEYKRPIITATMATEPGGPNIGGSAGDMLLLTLYNWPAQPQAKHEHMVQLLVAHEMSHRFQLRDAVDDYPDARLIHEGAAEFLRWQVSLRQGWLTPEQAGEDLDNALGKCVLVSGNRAWRDIPAAVIGGNQLEYACGLPAYVYALAARQGKGGATARIDAFYKELRAGRKPDFAQAMECGAAPCTPRVLPAVLSKPGPMRTQWEAALAASGLARPRPPTQDQTDTMMLNALAQLVAEDCNKTSMRMAPDRVLVEALKTCTLLRQDVVVQHVEGHPVFGGSQALPAMVGACSSRKKVALGLADGSTLEMPCRVPYQPLSHMYSADMPKLMRALGIM